jgi:hypothetical protein
MDNAKTQARKNLEDIFVFVNGISRERAEEMAACVDSEAGVEQAIAAYKGSFFSRRHTVGQRIPFIAVTPAGNA